MTYTYDGFPPEQLAYVQKRERGCTEHLANEFKRRLEAEPDFWPRYTKARAVMLAKRQWRIEHDPAPEYGNNRTFARVLCGLEN